MSAALSGQQLAEIRSVDLLELMSERSAGQISGYLATLLGEIGRLRAELGNAVATVARLEQKRVELERVANAERARVAELEAEPPQESDGCTSPQRLVCGHCPHQLCEDCDRCPCSCKCATGGVE